MSGDNDVHEQVRATLLATTGPTNLVGALGVGKSALVRGLPGTAVVDLDRPHAAAELRIALREHHGLVVADNADGRRHLGVAQAALRSITGPLVVVTRRPITTRPGWPDTPTVTLPPLPDDTIATMVRDAGATGADLGAVVRLAAGVPLLAEAACRALRHGLPTHPDGPLADHVTAEVLDRLGRELPGTRWRPLLRMLATIGAGDEWLLRARPDRFGAVADLSVVARGSSGLAVVEPYRALFDTAYRWRDPGAHEAARERAASYRLRRLARSTDDSERWDLTEQALFLQGDRTVRRTLFPPGRPPLPIRAARHADTPVIGRLMRRWAVRSGFDVARRDRLVEQWAVEDITGFQVIEDADGIVGLIRLVAVRDRTVNGVEPLLQQHTDALLAGSGSPLFLGAAYCPHPVAHAQLLRHILGSSVRAGRLLVSTASPGYQQILDSLRFRSHGGIRDDTFHCGRPPLVYSNQFAPDDLSAWLRALGHRDEPDRGQAVAWALSRLRDPSLAGSPLLTGAGPAAVAELRRRLVEAVQALADSPNTSDAEAGRILHAYYLGAERTHVQVALQLHLSRATYFRRLRHGHAAVADRLG